MELKTATWLVASVTAFGAGLWFSATSPRAAANQRTAMEVRLAETQPAAGLVEASVAGSVEKVYLHQEIVVTNDDIVRARVVPGRGGSDFSVAVSFTREGGAKLAQATASHIDRPLAILIDGRVVAAPTLRDRVSDSAIISGAFTSNEAAAIVAGLNRR